MGIRAVGAMRRAKLMIGGRILALAVQFTLARDAAAQLATDQPRLQMEQQCESAFALCASHMVVAETAGYVHQVVGLCESPGEQEWLYRAVEHSLPDGASDQSSRPPAQQVPNAKTVRHFRPRAYVDRNGGERNCRTVLD